MKKLLEKLKPVIKKMIMDMLKKKMGDGAFAEITAHQEEDDAVGKAMMKGTMKPWMKKMIEILKPSIKQMIKEILIPILKKKMKGGFTEIAAHQEEDDATGDDEGEHQEGDDEGEDEGEHQEDDDEGDDEGVDEEVA